MCRLWVLVDFVMNCDYLSKQLPYSQEEHCFVELVGNYYIRSFSKVSNLFMAKGRTRYSGPVRGPKVEN
jgi:hypothetical protein